VAFSNLAQTARWMIRFAFWTKALTLRRILSTLRWTLLTIQEIDNPRNWQSKKLVADPLVAAARWSLGL
jgi:hypothetical protein